MHLPVQNDPAWSNFVAVPALCQAAGELACWSQLHSSLANSGFWTFVPGAASRRKMYAQWMRTRSVIVVLHQYRKRLASWLPLLGTFSYCRGSFVSELTSFLALFKEGFCFSWVSIVWPFWWFGWEMCYYSDNILGVGQTCSMRDSVYQWFWWSIASSHHQSATLSAARYTAWNERSTAKQNECCNLNALFMSSVIGGSR